MFLKQKRLLILLFLLSVLFFLTGCTQEHSQISSAEFEKEPEIVEDERALLIAMGRKVKELSAIPGIDEPVISVNGYSITRKEIETQKILDEVNHSTSLKEIINSLIREKTIEAEAIRLDIQPSQDKINTYMEQAKESLENGYDGTELIFAYIDGMGITQEEYLEELEKNTYKIFQREALWTSVEASKKDKDFEKYVDDLVEKANIEFYDMEVKNIFDQ